MEKLKFSDGWIWSSTEFNDQYSYVIESFGYLGGSRKDYTTGVRLRAFKKIL